MSAMMAATLLFISRFIKPFSRLFSDIASLDPVLAQLLGFGILLGGVYGLAALGLTIIFGVMDVVNFAHGAMMTLGIYVVWFTTSNTGLSPFVAMPLAVVVLFVVGIGIHVSTIEPIVDEPGQSHLLVTFGWVLVIQSLLQIGFGPDPRQLELSLGSANVLGVFVPIGQLYALTLAIVAVAVVWGFLFRTNLGRAIRATADDRENAPYVGINVPRINYLTFGLGAALAGLSGGAISLFRLFDPFVGTTYLVFAFVTVVLGGLGSMRGALVGGLIIGLVQIFSQYYAHGSTYEVIIMGMFLVVLLVKPEGLFGGEV